MRSVLGLVVILVAVAVVLILATRRTEQTFDAVRAVAPALRENAPAVPFDEEEARRLAERLEQLSGFADLPREELSAAAATCAGWAASATPGSGAYRAAVKLRGAADALLAAGPRDEDPQRRRARGLVQEALAALDSPAAQVGGPAGAIRDQLENLQTRHQEELQQGSEALP